MAAVGFEVPRDLPGYTQAVFLKIVFVTSFGGETCTAAKRFVATLIVATYLISTVATHLIIALLINTVATHLINTVSTYLI